MSEHEKKMQKLIDGLNEDLSHEYAAVITYRTYASQVRGPHRQELRGFFASEIPDELLHAETLADKIVSLGGTPSTVAKPVKPADDAKQMLENALQDEIDTIARYVKRRKQAEDLDEYALAIEIDNFIADETKHRDELRLILDRWE
jgi:bacterioferritin